MLYYKIDVLAALKVAGYNTNTIRKKHLIPESTLTVIRAGKMIRSENLDRLCALLNCQPGDLIAWKPDPDESPKN